MIRLLAIVPARAGSKGVPGKNKALISGIPLIEYTIRALEAAHSVDAIVLTTNDADILASYRRRPSVFCVERPAALAKDTSPTADAVWHALDAWEAAGQPAPEALFLAQPTTPLRTATDIDRAFEMFLKSNGASVVSACRAEGIRHPNVMYRGLDDDGRASLYLPDADAHTQRQGLETIYQRNGAIYMVSTDFFRQNRRMRNATPIIYEMPWERSINIDVPGDLVIARALIESGLIKL